MNKDRYALIGWPVAHSASPAMQEAAFRSAGLNATYELIAVQPDKLAAIMPRLQKQGYRGWNVTVPHKEAVLPMLDIIDAEAEKTGSVNTVLSKQGKLWGYSTDGYGLAKALERNFQLQIPDTSILFLGTGGAARAAAVYAAMKGAAEIVLVNRSIERAEAIASSIRRVAPACQAQVLPLADQNSVSAAMRRTQVLIHGTSLGLHPQDPMPFPPSEIPSELPVFDMLYGNTAFQEKLRQRGNKVAAGWDMLIYQGCRSFELWTGLKAPEQAMRDALAGRGAS
jgi:shikimate dehydrogenase